MFLFILPLTEQRFVQYESQAKPALYFLTFPMSMHMWLWVSASVVIGVKRKTTYRSVTLERVCYCDRTGVRSVARERILCRPSQKRNKVASADSFTHPKCLVAYNCCIQLKHFYCCTITIIRYTHEPLVDAKPPK